MGRIQKKKSSRKKKKQSTKPAVKPQQGGDALEQKTALVSASAKDIAGRQAPSQKKQVGAIKPSSGLPVKGFIDKTLQFLREVKVELKKVTWPTRKQTLGSTAIVILLVMIISLFLGIVDIGLSNLIRVVLN